MERGLPEGLVTNKENAPGVFEDFDRIYVDQVIYLWRGLRRLSRSCPQWLLINFLRSVLREQANNAGRRRVTSGEFLLADLE